MDQFGLIMSRLEMLQSRVEEAHRLLEKYETIELAQDKIERIAKLIRILTNNTELLMVYLQAHQDAS